MIRTFNTNSSPMPDFGFRTIAFTSPIEDTVIKAMPPVFTNEDVNIDPCKIQYKELVLASDDLLDINQELWNDKKTFIYQLPTQNAVAITLEKWDGASWVSQGSIGTYGLDYGVLLGGDQQIFHIAEVNWLLVNVALGNGLYRVYATGTFLGDVSEVFSQIFCLKTYSINNANDSVRFEWNLNKIFYSNGIKLNFADLNIYQSIRVQGFFGYEEAEQEVIEIEYQNGQIDRVRDEMVNKYVFTSGRVPYWVHIVLKEQAFLSNTEAAWLGNNTVNYKLDNNLRVTDYNTNNPITFERFNVVRDGGYAPKYEVNSLLSRVVVEFKDKLKKTEHRRCE